MAATEKPAEEMANKDDRMGDLLIEKLRNKAAHLKSWNDGMKALRMALMEKRYTADTVERSQVQKCLDILQKSIKVTSLQSMVERLESITRQLNLKFLPGPAGTDWFISSDMFYIEILLETNGSVKDVKISHHGDPVSCPELSEVLSAGDFVEFTKHLEGLVAIYQLNADKKQKTKAFLALQALETDLSMLAQLQSTINEPSNFVHKSPVGILQPRKGGHPMKLTYFISPYDLLDIETKTSIPLTVETVLEKQLGHYVTVCIESSTSHKLQTQSLMSISRTPDGKSLPSFAAPSNLNSTTLPASFVLKLASPVPIAVALVKKIQAVTCIECADMSASQSLLSLITQHASDGQLDCANNKGLFVILPDQHHCYFLNGTQDLQGVMVSSIPFTHPTHVPQILVFLRQQMLFNVLISSCIRTCSKQDLEAALMFEVTALSWLHVSVSFEHPLEESMATAEFDLSDITNVKCKLYTMTSDTSICSDEYASKVIQRCLSIPVTMRAVIRKAQGQQKKCNQSNEDLYLTMVMGNSGKFSNHPPGYSDSNSNTKFVSDFDMKLGRSGNRSSDSQSISKLDMMNSGMNAASTYGVGSPDMASSSSSLCMEAPGYMDSSSSPAHRDLFSLAPDPRSSNHMLGSRFGPSHSPQSLNSASGKSVSVLNSNQATHGNVIGATSASFPAKPRKERGKRKAISEGSSPRSNTGRSPKRKHTDDELGKELGNPNMDVGGGSVNLGYGMNLELTPANVDCDSHVNKLPSSLDSIIKYDQSQSRSGSSDIDIEVHRSSSSSVTSLQEIMEKSSCEPNDMENELYNNANQGRSGEFQYKSEPIDFETEVQNSSFNDSLMDEQDEFNLEQLGINTSIITTKVTSSLGNDKSREGKKVKKMKLDVSGKLEKESIANAECEQKPMPVILDIISSQGKLVESTIPTKILDLTEKRPSVEIIPIGNINSSMTPSLTTTSSLLSSGLKIVNSALKSDAKAKQRDFRRGLGLGDRPEKKAKGEGKRERKRKHLEAMSSSDDKSTEIFGLSITPIPPTSTSMTLEKSTLSLLNSSSKGEPTIPKSITLSVKPITYSTTTSSTTITKTTSSKKPQLPLGTTVLPAKSISILKTPQNNKSKATKLSSSNKSLHVIGVDSKNAANAKVAISPLKVHSKFKSGSNSSKSGGSSPLVSGSNSPNKICTKPASVKLKPLNIPNSTTLTPISTKASTPTLSSASTSLSASLISMSTVNTTATITVTSPTTPTASAKSLLFSGSSVNNSSGASPVNDNGNNSCGNNVGVSRNGESADNGNGNNSGGNSSKHNKAATRSRKASLSAVIDKLVQASNPQTGTPCSEAQMYYSDRKFDSKSEGKESRQEKKEFHKDVGNLQKTNDKNKTGCGAESKVSDKKPEFTVKQSLQGIKLTVKRTEGGTKLSSSLKSGSSKSGSKANSSAQSSKASLSGSATGLKPGVNSGPASKKLNTSPSIKSSGIGVTGNIGSGNVSNVTSQSKPLGQKSSSMGTTKTPTSALSFKQSPKHSSLEAKVSSASMKSQPDKVGRSPIHETRPSTPKLEKPANVGVTNMPPPPTPVQPLDMAVQFRKNDDGSRQSSVRQSPKHVRDAQPEETEAERKFRLLVGENQSTGGSIPVSSVGSMKPSSVGGSSSDWMESVVTPKHELQEKSPKHIPSDGRSTPKNLTVDKTGILNKASQGEIKRPTTPKLLAENVQKAVEGILPIASSPADLSTGGKFQMSNMASIPKSKAQCLSSPSNDEISSPEDGLIIDYPGTPRQKSPDLNASKPSSSVMVPENLISTSQTKSPDKVSPASSLLTSRSPSQCSPIIKSPMVLGTPQSDHSNPSSVARSSPCVIDDDLMDEALIGIGK